MLLADFLFGVGSTDTNMFGTTDYFVLILLAFLLVERFFAYRISLSFKKDIDALQTRMAEMLSEFVKLATMLQAFLMNVRFKEGGEPEGKLKSTDTQVLVSAIELERLRDAERFLREESVERLLKRRTGGDGNKDELGEIVK